MEQINIRHHVTKYRNIQALDILIDVNSEVKSSSSLTVNRQRIEIQETGVDELTNERTNYLTKYYKLTLSTKFK